MEEMEKQEGQEGCRAEHSWEASAKATTRSSTEAGREETLMAALAVMKGKKPEKKSSKPNSEQRSAFGHHLRAQNVPSADIAFI